MTMTFKSRKDILEYSRCCAVEAALTGERSRGLVAAAVTPQNHVWLVCQHRYTHDGVAFPEVRAGDCVGVILCYKLLRAKRLGYLLRTALPREKQQLLEGAWYLSLPMAECDPHDAGNLPADCPLEFLHILPKYLRPSQEWRESVYRHHEQVLPYNG